MLFFLDSKQIQRNPSTAIKARAKVDIAPMTMPFRKCDVLLLLIGETPIRNKNKWQHQLVRHMHQYWVKRIWCCDQIEMEDLPAEESGSECGSTAGKPSVPRQALWMGKPQSSRFPTKLHHVNKCTTTLNTGIQHYYRMHAWNKGQRVMGPKLTSCFWRFRGHPHLGSLLRRN